MELWHGSDRIVRSPQMAHCRPCNDYGAGFYCTPSADMAREWACRAPERVGFANHYKLDETGLAVLDLMDERYTILNWIAILLEHRTFQPGFPIAYAGSNYVREHFLIDTEPFDLIRGYRADDSYFSFARAFINNQISVAQLDQAMRLGRLGEQLMVKSPEAFGRLSFIEAARVDPGIYFARREQRDKTARVAFKELRQEIDVSGIYLRDIVAQRMEADDERLR